MLASAPAAWFRLRDGWAVWGDAGTEAQYWAWRAEWERARRANAASSQGRKKEQ